MENITVEWMDPERTIILYTFPPTWQWAAFWEAFDKAHKMGASVSHRIDIIGDLSRCTAPPSNAITHLKSVADHQHPHAGLSVIVTEARVLQVLYKAARRIYPKVQHYFVLTPTCEEALATINSARRSNIPHGVEVKAEQAPRRRKR